MYLYKSFFLYIFTCLLILALTFFGGGAFFNKDFFLNYYGGVCGDSKLLEKTIPCTKRASTFDLGHILHLDIW